MSLDCVFFRGALEPDHAQNPPCGKGDPTLQYRGSPGNQSSASDPGPRGGGQPGFEALQEQVAGGRGVHGDRDALREAALERARSTGEWAGPGVTVVTAALFH